MASRFSGLWCLALLILTACAHAPAVAEPQTTPVSCGRDVMSVHFFDVGQGLAALVELPTGRLLLVDAGESPTRAGCGPACGQSHQGFMSALRRAVAERPIDVLWLTHPHSDHIGGALDVIEAFTVRALVHNGIGGSSATMRKLLAAASARGIPVSVASRGAVPGFEQTPELRVMGLLPASWPVDCERDANNCSAGLRVDYCRSSVVFVGDAEEVEEASLEEVGQGGLLQVGHHGSETSSSTAFLDRVKPSWAVISSGRPDEGTNRTYCHPRASAVARLMATLPGDKVPLRAFTGARCAPLSAEWAEVPSSAHLLVTSRDGDVVLETRGDGEFSAPVQR